MIIEINNAVKRTRKVLSGQRGFTLIELLVVLVILGVLAAIVVPMIIGAGDDADLRADESNIRILQNAVILYNQQVKTNLAADVNTAALEAALESTVTAAAATGGVAVGPWITEMPTPKTGGTGFRLTANKITTQ